MIMIIGEGFLCILFLHRDIKAGEGVRVNGKNINV